MHFHWLLIINACLPVPTMGQLPASLRWALATQPLLPPQGCARALTAGFCCRADPVSPGSWK